MEEVFTHQLLTMDQANKTNNSDYRPELLWGKTFSTLQYFGNYCNFCEKSAFRLWVPFSIQHYLFISLTL